MRHKRRGCRKDQRRRSDMGSCQNRWPLAWPTAATWRRLQCSRWHEKFCQAAEADERPPNAWDADCFESPIAQKGPNRCRAESAKLAGSAHSDREGLQIRVVGDLRHTANLRAQK